MFVLCMLLLYTNEHQTILDFTEIACRLSSLIYNLLTVTQRTINRFRKLFNFKLITINDRFDLIAVYSIHRLFSADSGSVKINENHRIHNSQSHSSCTRTVVQCTRTTKHQPSHAGIIERWHTKGIHYVSTIVATPYMSSWKAFNDSTHSHRHILHCL